MATPGSPTPYPPVLAISQIPPGETVEGFRAVHVPTPQDPDLPLSLCSHYEMRLGAQPAEEQHAAIYMAVSLWTSKEIVAKLARRHAKFGQWVARLELVHGHGFDRLDPALELNPKHLTVWGDRDQLARTVVDIVPVASL